MNASSGRISNPLSIPPTTYARAILDEKVKKKLLWWKNKCSIHKCIMIVRCFFAQQIFVFFYSIYFISLVLLVPFFHQKEILKKVNGAYLLIEFLIFLGKNTLLTKEFSKTFLQNLLGQTICFSDRISWKILLPVNLIFFFERCFVRIL